MVRSTGFDAFRVDVGVSALESLQSSSPLSMGLKESVFRPISLNLACLARFGSEFADEDSIR